MLEIGVSQYLLKPVSRKELTQALKDAISKISPKEEPETPAPEKLPMNQYIHFIEENYADPRLNLSYTARSFNLNPAYFSRKSKKKPTPVLLITSQPTGSARPLSLQNRVLKCTRPLKSRHSRCKLFQ